METLTTAKNKILTDAEAALVIDDAISAECNSTIKKVIAGQMIIEIWSNINFRSKCQKNSFDFDPDPTFKEWLAEKFPNLGDSRARRWMRAAKRIILSILKVQFPNESEPLLQVKLDGENCSIYEVLTVDQSDCGDDAIAFRDKFHSFLTDMTLSEAVTSAIDDESDPSRITRAYNGKKSNRAGGGGDRKDFPEFTRKALQKMTNFLTAGKPRQMRKLDPDQLPQMISAFISEIQLWPRDYLEAIMPAIEEEIERDDYQREHRASK